MKEASNKESSKTEKKKRRKAKSITQTILTIIVGVAIGFTVLFLLTSSLFFNQQITQIYEEMDEAIANAAKTSVSWEEAYMLAARVMRAYQSIENPVELYNTDREAYDAYFDEIEATELYSSAWQKLNSSRRGSDATAIDFVLLFPEENRGLYIIDASDANVLPCGEMFDMDLSAYVGHPGRSFDGVETTSSVYGVVRTDGIAYVTDPSRDIYGYLLTDIPVSEIQTRTRIFLFETAGCAAILTFVICLIAAIHFRKRLVQPLEEITNAAEEFTGNYELRVGTHDETRVFTNVSGGRIRELQNLTSSVQSMELEINSYIRDIGTMASEKARIGTELEIATRIQSSWLPNEFPAFPGRDEFDLYATMTPAKEVGGDFYDYFLIDDDKLGLVMADVSGKGVPGALFMMVSKTILKYRAINGGSPADILAFVNKRLCEQNAVDMFVTIWFGILTISTGEVVSANAGHEYPAVMHGNGDYEIIKDKHSFVCGGMQGIHYKEYSFKLDPGDRLFLYTDGVPEATDLKDELFGTDRMLAALNECKDASPMDTLAHVQQKIDEFVGPAEQFDDTTMMCLIYKGKAEVKGEANMKELRIEALVENLDKVQAFVEELLEEGGCPMKQMITINIAVEEIYVNIASYSYPSGTGEAVIRMEVSDNEATIIFEDTGIPYDPLAKEDPDVTLSAEERQIGGLGIYMVKKSMDSMEYEYRDNKNILTLKKKFL